MSAKATSPAPTGHKTFPTQRAPENRAASDSALAVLNNATVPNNDGDPDIVTAKHGLAIEDMKGLAYDDPQWDQLLEQMSVDEMVNLVSNGGWTTQAVPSIGKLNYVEVDGPNGINNIMAHTTGNQYCAQSVLACSWNTELAVRMGETFAKEAIAMDVAALYAPAMNIHRSPSLAATMNIIPRTASTPARWLPPRPRGSSPKE